MAGVVSVAPKNVVPHPLLVYYVQSKATQIKSIVSQAVEMRKVRRHAHFYFVLQASHTN